jgi:hypothetical protein
MELCMGRHVLILNRSNNRYAQYHRYVDHHENQVSYLVTEAGARPLVPDLAEEIRVLADLGDREAVIAAAEDLTTRHGPFTDIVALSEFDVELGADLRARLGVAGKQPAEAALVRDKVMMKAAVAAAGLRVPAHFGYTTPEDIRTFAAATGFPLVLKPRRGADSQGIYIMRSAQDLENVLASADLTDYQCEEFIDGDLYQVDGLVARGVLRTVRSWHCLVSCLEFKEGTPFGSVANDDPAFEARIVAFTRQVLAALRLTDDVFHLEVFRVRDTNELVFLELGARPGGGQVRFIWEEVYGVDLVEAAVHVQLGIDREYPRADVGGDVGAYLMMPEPPIRPCIVHEVRSLVGLIPELHAETLVPKGTVLNGNGGAVYTAGAFRFRAGSSAQAEQAIEMAMKLYKIDWSPAHADA